MRQWRRSQSPTLVFFWRTRKTHETSASIWPERLTSFFVVGSSLVVTPAAMTICHVW